MLKFLKNLFQKDAEKKRDNFLKRQDQSFEKDQQEADAYLEAARKQLNN